MGVDSGVQLKGKFRLLGYLATQPRTPTELASLESKQLSAISRWLGELRKMGYVEATPTSSRERYYKVTNVGYAYYTVMTIQTR